MNGDVGMQWKEEVPLAILSSILAQSCRTPPYIYSGKGATHDCASILDSIVKGSSCFLFFLHCASLHPHSMLFTLVLIVFI